MAIAGDVFFPTRKTSAARNWMDWATSSRSADAPAEQVYCPDFKGCKKVDLLIGTADGDLLLIEGIDTDKAAMYTSALFWKPTRTVPKVRVRSKKNLAQVG